MRESHSSQPSLANICFHHPAHVIAERLHKNRRESPPRAPGNDLLQVELNETASEAEGKHLERSGDDMCAEERCREELCSDRVR